MAQEAFVHLVCELRDNLRSNRSFHEARFADPEFPSSSRAASNPEIVTFFKAIPNVADSTGVLTTVVSKGLPVEFYCLSATNGQLVLLPVLQHGAVDDAIYVSVHRGGGRRNPYQTAFPVSSSGSGSATGSDTKPSTTSPRTVVSVNIGVAVGAIAGAALIVLTRIDEAPAVLTSEDFAPPPPVPFVTEASEGSSMSQLRTSPLPTSHESVDSHTFCCVRCTVIPQSILMYSDGVSERIPSYP
ncbi:hypothetical protein K438DRAFT_1963939 [Mycena galopus ATCC 62051]|nr:hypothetical protein K438DRAFT_1963939 [Mycena galopus ATCC 62051]